MTTYKFTLTNRVITASEILILKTNPLQIKIISNNHKVVGSVIVDITGSDQTEINGTFRFYETSINTLETIKYNDYIIEQNPKIITATGTIITTLNQLYYDLPVTTQNHPSIVTRVPNSPQATWGTNGVVKYLAVDPSRNGDSECITYFNKPGVSADVAINYSDAGTVFANLKQDMIFRTALLSNDGNPLDPTANVPIILQI